MAAGTKRKTKKVTPLMQQYNRVKAKHPEAILLFRVGDFYETFGQDAVKAAQVLGIVLTNRNNGGSKIELAGFPHHSMDTYLPRLVKAGYRVAICEQLEKPSKEKKIVKRGVTEVVTPGLVSDDKLLDHGTNNYLASLYFGRKDRVGLAFIDISTGEFLLSEGTASYADKMLQSLQPSEVIYAKDKKKDFEKAFGDKFYAFPLEEWVYARDYTQEKLLGHFDVKNLKGFGVAELELAQVAAGAVLHYLQSTENNKLGHITRLSRIMPERYVWLDRFTIRNLELLNSPHEGGVSLLNILDKTSSPMGARLLRKWVVLPLTNVKAIAARHGMVQDFYDDVAFGQEAERCFRAMGDLERLIGKVPLGKINPREVAQLGRALAVMPALKELLAARANTNFQKLGDSINECTLLRNTIQKQVVEDPPVNLNKGGVFADGVNLELDDLRNTIKNSKDLLLDIQQREAAATGIASLKIGFNNVFGYYLEVTNKYKNKDLIPDGWVRKQTLTNAERYITDELKKLEAKILNADTRICELEEELFEELLTTLNEYIRPIQHNAAVVAQLDCLLSFARVARKQNYCRPEVNEEHVLDITAGRHPVIEQQLEPGNAYVPNDVCLDPNGQQIMMITGPNMAGKSALLRQTALISLMAQMGSFVPAERAVLGLVDKVFTRVGASDNISSGESTFMVEMNETASILNNVSNRSLILLDEIGRGTSTYDGISIAWSIAEYLHSHGDHRPKTLFATHYHELNELAHKFERIKNYSIAVREMGQKIIFLRKLVPGGSEHSFGIHVARMAGMPRSIVERATHILHQLEQQRIEGGAVSADGVKTQPAATQAIETMQLSIFETVDPTAGKLKEALQDIHLNSMTPIECMMKLQELLQIVEE